MKLLFLDVDGVLNNKLTPHRGQWAIDAYMCLLVGRIVEATGCWLVLSSSWRHFPGGLEEVSRRVGPIWRTTPTLKDQPDHIRGDEINAFLASVACDRYAILDDDKDFYPEQPLFQTSWDTGLTEDIANEVIKYLNA